MRSDRRAFLRRTAAGAVAAAGGLRTLSAEQRPEAMPTPRAAAFMRMFGLKYPIANAGMGNAANPALASAVANAGGLGAIGTGTAAQPDTVARRVRQTRELTRGPFAINYLLAFEPATLKVALDAGVPIVQFAWGLPPADAIAAIARAGAKFGVQVASAAGARRAIDSGAAYLICQGTEAGGHVQSMTPLYDLLPAVLAEAKDVPVLAAGGISTGAHLRRALLAGASGALVGTRFIATREAASHDEYKKALTRSQGSDTVMTVCFQDGWTGATHRVLRNRTLEMWEAAGCPPPGRRPGEGDVISTNAATGVKRLRYGVTSPQPDDRGDVLEQPLYCGRGVGEIRDVPSAADLIARLWKECVDAG